MVQSLANFFTRIMQRWLPDAFLFAIILTFIVLFGGVFAADKSVNQMIDFWGDGVWNLLTFSMQALLTLVTGHVLAQTPLVNRGLRSIASLAKTPGQAIVLMTVIALICGWINWGFGLIASGLFAREIAQRVKGVHYPLLVAAAYSGMLIWHAGLSGTIPLKIAVADGDILGELLGGQSIPVSETIFSGPVLMISGLLILTVPIVYRLMMPAADQVTEIPDALRTTVVASHPVFAEMSPAERLENSMLVSLLLSAMGLYYLLGYFMDGGKLGLNSLNMIFLMLGLLLQKTPANYLRALNHAIGSTSGIVLQFPLYAGIMGMMVQSGLAVSISEWFVGISTAETFTLFTFLSAGVVNFFVPSGGGQWAIQAPIVIPAAEALGVPLNQAAMAVAFGDAWTNMVQPFWALPLLGIAGLGIKDIMGYCTVALLWSGLVMGLGMLFLF
ncbi:MAG: short-chain fatty acid transporter [Gammaproteobacteria bacterium]|nr:MAG: short-chain fatty acid transporter [Gammaproteobacteria bacterium]RLA48208.1 MAG: short-chain fatty acid transporter [Gammaproteobacteria bacterium]